MHAARLDGAPIEFAGRAGVGGERLLAHHVQARVEGLAGLLEMVGIGRADVDYVRVGRAQGRGQVRISAGDAEVRGRGDAACLGARHDACDVHVVAAQSVDVDAPDDTRAQHDGSRSLHGTTSLQK